MTIGEAFEAFELDELRSENRKEKTVANYHNACSSLLRSIGGDIPLELLAYNHVLKWKKDLYESGISSSHLAYQLMKLRRVLMYLKSHGFATLDSTEIKIPSFKIRETPWLSIDEVRQFLAVIKSPRDKALFALQFSSGARISELLSLNRDSIVDGNANIIGKGDKAGILHFDSAALGALDRYLVTRHDDLSPLFISRQNRRIHVTRVIQLAHEYAELAGIDKNVTTHVFRHSFASNLELNGMDIYGIATQMRHSRLETTRIYLHAGESMKKDNYEKYHTPTPI